MFSSSSPSPITRELDISRNKNYAIQAGKCNFFIENVAKAMIADPNLLKQVINGAITAYLSAIENAFFRSEGRHRAKELQKEIQKSNSTLDLILNLKEVIDKGNEDADSFKTFLFKAINFNFCENNAIKMHPSFSSYSETSYTDCLKDIINAVEAQLRQVCLTTFVDESVSSQKS